MKQIGDLFGNMPKRSNIRSERALVLSDIIEVANASAGIRKKLTARNVAVFLSPFTTSELYVLLSKMRDSKTPAALFWWHVKGR